MSYGKLIEYAQLPYSRETICKMQNIPGMGGTANRTFFISDLLSSTLVLAQLSADEKKHRYSCKWNHIMPAVSWDRGSLSADNDFFSLKLSILSFNLFLAYFFFFFTSPQYQIEGKVHRSCSIQINRTDGTHGNHLYTVCKNTSHQFWQFSLLCSMEQWQWLSSLEN